MNWKTIVALIALAWAAESGSAREIEFSATTFEVPARFAIEVMKSAGDSNDEDLFQLVVNSFAKGDAEIVMHFSSGRQSGDQFKFSAQRGSTAPWYLNMLHLDWAQRYNPRDTGTTPVGPSLEISIEPAGDEPFARCSFVIDYSHGKEVTRSYGTKIEGVSGKEGWPNFAELPAFPKNSILGHANLPLNGKSVLAAVTQPIHPGANKSNSFERKKVYHLTFVRATGAADAGRRPANRQYWAAVYELTADQAGKIKEFDDLPRDAKPVDFTLVSSRSKQYARVQSTAAFVYPDALLGVEDPVEGIAFGTITKRGALRPFKNDTGIEGARANFSRNLRTRELRLGTELQIVELGDASQFMFRRTAVPPKLREVKLAYPVRTEFVGNAQEWTPAFFEQFDVKNENAEGKLEAGAGNVSQPFVLGEDAGKGVTRILFVGSR